MPLLSYNLWQLTQETANSITKIPRVKLKLKNQITPQDHLHEAHICVILLVPTDEDFHKTKVQLRANKLESTYRISYAQNDVGSAAVLRLYCAYFKLPASGVFDWICLNCGG